MCHLTSNGLEIRLTNLRHSEGVRMTLKVKPIDPKAALID